MIVVWAPRLITLITGNFARAITLFPFVLLRYHHDQYNSVLINHERIHWHQQRELLIVPFYVLYLAEYGWRRLQGLDHMHAYLTISFEQEAYRHEADLSYLSNRPRLAFRRYYNKRH